MPLQRKLSRKERRKASQLEREREREAARITGSRVLHHDPYRYFSSFASITLTRVYLKSGYLTCSLTLFSLPLMQ